MTGTERKQIHGGQGQIRVSEGGYVHADLTREIVGCAIATHRALGPGLLEGAYRACLARELHLAGLEVQQEVPLAISYRGDRIDCSYRLDLIVERTVLVELKAVEAIQPIHTAQLLTYLKLSDLQVGLLLNFNELRLCDGIRRVVR